MYKLESWSSRVEAEMVAEGQRGRRRSRSKSASGCRRVSFSDEQQQQQPPPQKPHNACGGTVIYTANITASSGRRRGGRGTSPLTIDVLKDHFTSDVQSLQC